MDGFARILVAFCAAGLACGGTDPMPTENVAPELGRYAFTATWNEGLGSAHGDLLVHAANETEITYTFILKDFDGTNLEYSATFDRASDLDDWIISSASIYLSADGAYVLKPHLAHIAGGYRCSGSAVDSNAREFPLTCKFSYKGPQ